MSALTTPAGVLVSQAAPDSPEWHAARLGGVGSSEVAVLVGLGPNGWDSPRSLYHRKRGDLPDKGQNLGMRWGRICEDGLATEWAREHPAYEVAATGTWMHRERPWQRANPDRLVVLDGAVVAVLEVKTGSTHEEGWGEDGSDEIPLHYRCQVMWQLDTLGLAVAHVIAGLDGRHIRQYVIDYDEGDAKLLRDAAEEFWRRVLDGRAPDVDWTAPTTAALKAVYRLTEDAEVDVGAELATEYAQAQAAAKAADERKSLATNRLLERMGDARWAVHDGRRVATRSVANRRGYTVAPRTGVVTLTPARPPKAKEST